MLFFPLEPLLKEFLALDGLVGYRDLTVTPDIRDLRQEIINVSTYFLVWKWLVGTIPSLWTIQEIEGKKLFLILLWSAVSASWFFKVAGSSVPLYGAFKSCDSQSSSSSSSPSFFYNELSLLPNLQYKFLEFILLSWSIGWLLDRWDINGLLFENLGQELTVKADILFWMANFAWQFRKINVTFWNEPEQQMLLRNLLHSEIFHHNLL